MINHRIKTIVALMLAAATGECVGDVPITGANAIDVCATNLATDSKGLAVGPDGNLWFNTYNVIGRLNIRIFKNGFDTAP